MPIRPIIRYPADVLTTPADKVGSISDDVAALIEDMIATMRDAQGVGLAAPQVGISLRISVLEYQPDDDGVELEPVPLQVLINPKIISRTGDEETEPEGCLSLPGIEVPVRRHAKIKVRALDQDGKIVQFRASGFWARIVQHEVDHLNGTLIIDYARNRKKILAEYEEKKGEGKQSLL